MADAPIKINIVEGERGTYTRKGWQQRERIAIVPRVGGVGAAKLYAAIVRLQADPANRAGFGDEHPGADNCFLEELEPEAISSDDVRIRMVYKFPEFQGEDEDDDAVIEVGSTLIQTTINRDVDAQLMTVEYDDPTEGTLSQSGLISIPVPQSTVRYQLRLNASPGGISRQFVGKVNSGGWWADPGAEARTWMCTEIVGRSDDRGVTYLTNFEFAFLEDTYDERVVYIKPETGRPPDDIVEGVGDKTFQVIVTANFNAVPH